MDGKKTTEGPAQKTIGDTAPRLAELTDDVLFGDVWERPQLSKRDWSLITCAALVATGKPEQMNFHFPRAIENGVTREELIELIMHLALYAGWPNASRPSPRSRNCCRRSRHDVAAHQLGSHRSRARRRRQVHGPVRLGERNKETNHASRAGDCG
jgi:4-carboxymuconolactone decarboxylase